MPMAHEVFVDPRGERVEVHYHGLVTIAERHEALVRAVALLRPRGIDRVLVSFADAQAAAEDFEASNRFAALLAREALRCPMRVAYLAPHSWQVSAAVEQLLMARRFPCARFNNRAAALAWLERPPEQGGPD